MSFETISLTLTAFVGAALAIASVLHSPRSRTSFAFCAMSLSLCAHDILCVIERYRSTIPFNSPALHGATILLLGPAAGWFALSLVPKVHDRFLTSLRLFFLVVLAAILIFSFGFNTEQETHFVQRSHEFILFPVVLWLVFFFHLARKSTLPREQSRFRQTFWGGLALALFFLTDALALEGFPVPPLGTLARLLYLLLLFQLFVRRELATWEEVAAKLALFVGLAGILAIIYHLLTTWIGERSGLLFFASFIASSVVVILFEPVLKTAKMLTRRLFLRQEQWMEERVAKCAKDLWETVGDPLAVAHRLSRELNQTFYLNAVAFYILEKDGYLYRNLMPVQVSNDGFEGTEILASDPLIEFLVRRREKFFLWEGADDPAHLSPWEARLKALNTDFILPFFYEHRLVGFATTSPLGRNVLTPKQIRLLTALSRQVAYLLRNAELVTELRDNDRLALAGEMAAGLAHEIKNPLGAIKGAAEILKETTASSSQQEEFLNIIVGESIRLTNVLSEFLDYARPRRIEQQKSCNLIQVIEHTAKVAFTDYRAEFSIKTDSKKLELEADPDLLKQVFLNLFLNSLDAVRESEHPSISVEIHERNSSLVRLYEIIVRDSGAGIPTGAEEKIFDPFFTTKHQGTGLGLSICRRLLANMKGSIFCRPSENGAAFIVHLPRAGWQGSYA